MIKPLMLAAILALPLSACTSHTAPPAKRDINKPKLLSAKYPLYPAYARANALTGHVKFEYDVGADGKVSQIRIIESQPHYLFDGAVIQAVAKWQFEKNKPYKGMVQTVRFVLNRPDKPITHATSQGSPLLPYR
ncbi:hypothetical protein GCM10023078_36490 [Gibbsiella greigii]